MNRFNNLNIRQRPVVSAIFYYSDCFIDSALRLHGDIHKALFLYLKHEGYKNIIFYSTVSGPNSFDKEMLINFLYPDQSLKVNADTDELESRTMNKGENPRNPFRRARQQADNNSLINDNLSVVTDPSKVILYDDQISRYTRKGSSSSQSREHRGGNRDANIMQLCYSLTRISNSVLVIDSNYNEGECSVATSSHLYDVLVNTLGSRYGESQSHNSNAENRVIVLMPVDSGNTNAVSEIFKERPQSIFFANTNFCNLWRETIPMLDDISTPKDTDGVPIKRLSHNSFFLPAPQANDIKNIIELEHLQYPNTYIEWAVLDELTRQLSVLATLAGDNQHSLREHRNITYQALSSNNPLSFENYSSLETRKMKLGMKNNQKLDDLIGLQSVKETIDGIKAQIKLNRRNNRDAVGDYGNHMLFLGNPGTGKTTVARIVAAILKELGVVSKGQLIEVSAENLVAGYVGQTAIKTSEVIDSAMGGVLFVDEAYRLTEGGSREFGAEAVNTLLARMENDRKDLVVIFAGYEENMKSLYSINPGLKSRIKHTILFDDYSADELKQIFVSMAQKRSFVINDEINQMLSDMMGYVIEYKDRRTDEVRSINAQRINDNNHHEQRIQRKETYNFGNGRWVRNLLSAVETKVAIRSVQNPEVDPYRLILDDFRNLPDIEELHGFIPGLTTARQKDTRSAIEQLEDLVGMQEVKKYVQQLKNDAEYRHRIGKASDLGVQHLILYGNPGTGKTTVARLLADIYYELGLLPRRNIVEVRREQLVVGFQGQTAPNVAQRIQAAKGGVLFIDEAYSLYRGKEDSCGIEAVNTLVSYLENDRNDIVVIMAGYKDNIDRLLNEVNTGMSGRFPNRITIGDYSKEELYKIATSMLDNRGYTLTDDAKEELMGYVISNKDNARWVRNLVDKIISAHRTFCVQNACYSSKQITVSELRDGISLMENNQ